MLLILLVLMCFLVPPATVRLRRLQQEPVHNRAKIVRLRWAMAALSGGLLVVAALILVQVLR